MTTPPTTLHERESEPTRLGCPEKCLVPAGYSLVETPPSRHAWSDVVRCPNDGCGRTFLITSRPEVTGG